MKAPSDDLPTVIHVAQLTAAPSVVGNTVTGGATGILAQGAGAQVLTNAVANVSDAGIKTGATRRHRQHRDGGDRARHRGGRWVHRLRQHGVRRRRRHHRSGPALAVSDNRVGLKIGQQRPWSATPATGITRDRRPGHADRQPGRRQRRQGHRHSLRRDRHPASNRSGRRTGIPIASLDGPDAPVLAGVVTHRLGRDSARTLLLTGLPEGDAGTIEVFANPSCDAGGGEAEFLMDITRNKATRRDQPASSRCAERRARDHFTVTYTDAEAAPASCRTASAARTYTDGDGDGSVDPLDDLLGFDDDPDQGHHRHRQRAAPARVVVLPFDPDTGDRRRRVRAARRRRGPAPDGHPAGWSLPYGAISFRITGLTPGSRTTVVLAQPDRQHADRRRHLLEVRAAHPRGGVQPGILFGLRRGQWDRSHPRWRGRHRWRVRRAWALALGDGLAATATAVPTAPSPTPAARSSPLR